MKRVFICLICLAAVLLLLSGCNNNKEVFEEVGSAPTATPITQTQFTAGDGGSSGIMDANPYDSWAEEGQDAYAGEALTEENFTDPDSEAFYASPNDIASAETAATSTLYPYAGTTPILLDPIDKPTPTPKAQFTLSYGEYYSVPLGLSFKAPVGWTVDESQLHYCIISEPENTVRDNRQCMLIVSAEPVTDTYDEKALTNLVKERLSAIQNTEGIKTFKPSLTATRTTMGRKGVYANYYAVYEDGTEIGGRVLYVSLNKMLYGLEIVYPYGYKSSYEPAFGELRGSMTVK